MTRLLLLWLTGAASIAVVVAGLANLLLGHVAWDWLAIGVGVSLTTLIASQLTLLVSQLVHQPLQRMLVGTSLRVALPLSFLLAAAVAKWDLLNKVFLLYFLPFQFLTLAVQTVVEVQRIKSQAKANAGSTP